MQSVHYNKPILQCTMPILRTIISTPHQAMLCSAKSVWSVSWVPSPLAAVCCPTAGLFSGGLSSRFNNLLKPFPNRECSEDFSLDVCV